ncbi:amino acid ABC transporter permease [Williamsia maris]|uniref:Amino acid ABC transporter membrane protein, PAAT family (TC 3.A.1.3.-) n=1 Tax=Williamsia maris TaxID=72806 RepID=A0ABT1H9B5_9NOCA|nr:amino acid ABC transporter permease [Williamsia maris]MCP2174542.1 amino acid ABC transporter membrane protein, PAAT family (TC 3.A.1.3.-) [Williamsia maris]
MTSGATPLSERQLERQRYRRRRTRTRAAIAAVSTVVVLGIVIAVVISSPGWDRVHATFFDWDDAKGSFPDVAKSFWLNIRLFLVVEVFVLVLGLVVAIIRVIPSPALAPIKLVAVLYTDIFRGTPTLLIVLLVGFGVPALELSGLPTSLFWLGVIALTLSYGAYVAEVIRAGILSVHPSQWASGRAIGLSYGKTLRHVILPQALRRVAPPLLNDFVSLQKDTALLSTIGLVESLRAAQVISGRDFVFTPYVVAACFFIVATIPLARLTDYLTVRSMRREGGF